MSQSPKFWDRIAARYAKAPIRDEAVYNEKLEITQRYLSSEMNVMEFGCGTGTTAIAHAPFVAQYLAVDLSSKMLEFAQSKAKAAGITNLSFKQMAIEDFVDEANQFDVVMAHSVLHLLESPQDAIAKVYKLLKPGGIFVTSTACVGEGSSVFKVLLPFGRFLRLIPHVCIFDRQTLESYFTDAGFAVEFQRPKVKKEAAFIILKKPPA